MRVASGRRRRSSAKNGFISAEKYQGKGYAKAATMEVLGRLKERGAGRVYVGYKPQNVVAASLLASLGFKRTGQMLQGEFIAKLEFE